MDCSKICRLCLKETYFTYSLAEEDGIQLLRDVASIEIEEADPFPKSACITCWLSLKHAYKIREHILKTEEKLKSLLFSPDLIIDDEGFVSEESLLSIIKANSRECKPGNNSREHKNETPMENPNQPETPGVEPVETIKIENYSKEDFTILIVKDQNPAAEENPKKKPPEKSNCRICGDLLLETEQMDHFREHFEVKETCEICGVECENLNDFRWHIKSEHDQDLQEVYRCVICFASFQYKTLYRLHRERAHKYGEIYDVRTKENYMKKMGIRLSDKAWRILADAEQEQKCDICDKVFPTLQKFSNHMASHRSRRQCPVCGKLHSAANLNAHMRTHNSESVACQLCGAVSKNIDNLRSHMTIAHSTKKYPCEHCGKVFPVSYKRKIHIKKEHIGEKDHICPVCGKSFFTQFRLNDHHRNVHLKIRKFECSYCNKSFVKKWNLDMHERMHTKEAPYVCGHCGKGFRQNVSLKSHLRSNHEDESNDEDLVMTF